MNTWNKTKVDGDNGEKAVAKYCESNGFEATRIPGDSNYDIQVRHPSTGQQWRVEVKNDQKALETGNVAIEVSHRGKPSGINTTSADWFINIVGNTAYVAKMDELHKHIVGRQHHDHLTAMGDDKLARGYCIPISEYRELPFVSEIDLTPFFSR